MIFVPFLREPRKIDFLFAGFPQRLSPSPQIYRGILVIPIPCTSLHQLLQCSLQNKKAKVTLLEISSQLLTLTDAFSLSPNKRRLHCFVEHFGENSPSCFGADIGKFVSPV